MKKLMEMSVKEEPAREVTLLKPEYLSAVGAKADEMHPPRQQQQQGRVLTPVSEEVALSPGAKDELDENAQQQPKNGLQPLQQQQQQREQQRAFKRRNSLNVGFKHPGFKRRRRANSDCDPVLPSNFLLGGNIFDPLNLNSLLDEEVNKALNAETPKSSPLPCRNRDPVEILVPKDITDPLSLNTGSEVLPSPLKLGRKRRHRHSHHPPSQLPQSATAAAAELAEKSRVPTLNAQDCATDQQPPPEAPPAEQEGPQPYELNTAINCRDEIVSPVLRGVSEPSSGGGGGTRHRKRRRTSSKSEPGKAPAGTEEEPKEGKKPTPEKTRGKASHHHHQHHPHQHNYHRDSKAQPNFQSKHKRFQYGNYSKYYGYRNPGRCEDPRLAVLQPAWFRGKDILDLGCNAGHLTLSIAKDLRPARIVGVDIDGTLVHSARQNIRHFLSEDVLPSPGSGAAGQVQRHFPLSLSRCRGPIAAPPVTLDRCVLEFPNNVTFIQVGVSLRWVSGRGDPFHRLALGKL